MPRPGESKTSPRRLAAAERQRQALRLREGGADFGEIAQALGYADPSGAYRSVEAALRRVPALEAQSYRKLNLRRLNRARLAIQRRVSEGDVSAIDRELAIQREEARLLGLYAPERIDLTLRREQLIQAAREEGMDETEAVTFVEEYLRARR